jgi:hypothetical protein
VFENLTTADYKTLFDRAKLLFKSESFQKNIDTHDLAHQAVELYFFSIKTTPTLTIEDVVKLILKKNSCTSFWADVKLNIEPLKQNRSFRKQSALSDVDSVVDLGRLYLKATDLLTSEDKSLFLKIWSLEELTDTETESIDALGEKMKRVLHGDVKTTTENYDWRSGYIFFQKSSWEKFHKKRSSYSTSSNQTRNRRPRKRLFA